MVTPPRDASSAIRLRTETLVVGDRTFQIDLPADANDVLDAALTAEDTYHEANPYWGIIWPAARSFAEFLMMQHPVPPRQQVLELGCGVGLVGLAALSRGYSVTFSDVVPLAVEIALSNARSNGFDQVKGNCFDWLRPPSTKFDLVLGSDVLYETHSHGPLLNTLATALLPSGEAWIADTGRQAAENFLATADAAGFGVEVLSECGRVLPEPGLGTFRIYRLQRTVSH